MPHHENHRFINSLRLNGDRSPQTLEWCCPLATPDVQTMITRCGSGVAGPALLPKRVSWALHLQMDARRPATANQNNLPACCAENASTKSVEGL